MTSNIVLLLSGFLGYIIVFITIFNTRFNRILNFFLIFIIIFSSSLMILAGLGEIYNNSYLKDLHFKLNSCTGLFLPAFYLYFKYLISNNKRLKLKDLNHLIFLFLVIIERELVILDRIVGFRLNYKLTQFFLFYSIIYILIIFQMLFKNVWYKTGTINFIIAQNNLIKKWTIILFITIIAFISRFYIVYFDEYLYSSTLHSNHSIKNLWVNGLVWILIYLIILSHQEILFGYPVLVEEITNNRHNSNFNNYWNIKSKITINNNQDKQLKEKISSKIENYLIELNTLLHANNYFKNPKFSVKDLAQVLNIPISHLKYVFKYHSKISFSDYKKISRIQNSLTLINNNYLNTNTLESLSKEVGFESYNPFFTCFKDIVGKSPHEYITTLKVNLNEEKSGQKLTILPNTSR